MRFRLEMNTNVNHNIIPHNQAYYEVGPRGKKQWYINIDGMSELTNFVTNVGGEVVLNTRDNYPYPIIKLISFSQEG